MGGEGVGEGERGGMGMCVREREGRGWERESREDRE